MKTEILRKSIHLSSLIYPFLYLSVLNQKQMIILTLSLAIFLLLMDILRMKVQSFKNLSNKCFSKISRSKEIDGHLYGSTYFMIGTCLTITLFPKEIAILALFVLIISDTCASLFGKAIKSVRIYQEKTLAGFLAFIISASIISIFGSFYFIISALITAVIELYAKKTRIDDNLLIPLSYGFISLFVNYII